MPKALHYEMPTEETMIEALLNEVDNSSYIKGFVNNKNKPAERNDIKIMGLR